MTIRFNGAVKLLALAAALCAASGASAQSKGDYFVRVGVNKITPKVKSGDVTAPALPGTKAEVGSDTKPIFSGGYMITDHISTELVLGVPYKHDLYGAGSIEGTGKLGSAEVLPPTLFGQYRFLSPTATARPYVGLGLTYAFFQKERGSGQLTSVLNTGGPGSTFSLDAKWALSYQLGTSIRINDKWFADVNVVKSKLKTTAHYSTGQTMDIHLDPLAVSLAVGYKF